MDTSEGFDFHQQAPQENHQQATSLEAVPIDVQQPQQSDMQCEPIYPLTSSNTGMLVEQMATEQMSNYDMDTPAIHGCESAPALYESRTTTEQAQNSSSSPDVDVDSLLLQQFSCLGTTDHEDLVNQFRALLNHETTKDSAKFFLEMSNWNLQAAIGCYLDYFNGQQLPAMKIVLEARPTQGQQAWRIRNEGSESWPTGCYLISPGQDRRVDVPALNSGECCDIIADIPPTHPTMCIWRLCTPYGSYFGDAIIMMGWKDTQTEISDRMAQLCTTAEDAANTIDTNSNCGIGGLQVKVVKVNLD